MFREDFLETIIVPYFQHFVPILLIRLHGGAIIVEILLRAARIVPIGIPLVRRLGWRTVKELIDHAFMLMIFNSLHGPASQYMSDLCAKNPS